MTMLDLQDVRLSIKRKRILNGVNLTIEHPEVVGIIGQNGSGKTTLLRAACGLARCDGGSVTILGARVSTSGRIPQGIGVVFDPPALIADLTGLQNLITIAKIRNELSPDDCRLLLTRVGLDPDEKRRVSKYSQGMKKRLGIAIASMENPRIVFMDEPTNGLDPEGVVSLRSWISDLKASGACVVVVGHYLQEMRLVCDRIFTMADGTLQGAIEHQTDSL